MYLDVNQVREDLKRWNKKLTEVSLLINELNQEFQDLWEAINQDAQNKKR